MGLVDDQSVVFEESTIVLDLGEQHAVRHQLDTGLGAHPVMKTDLVAHQIPEFAPQFLGNPAGQAAGGDPPRLGMTDPSAQATPQFQTELGQLGRLAGTGLATQHHHLVGLDQFGDLGTALAYRQFRRVGDGRDQGATTLHQRLRRPQGLP